MNTQSLVSVGIPTYNRPEGLRKSLKSITAQTYKNLEIIVSDNCSPNPQVEQTVKEFMNNDSRIIYYRQEQNKGPLFNFRFVVKKAKGEYFMWAADDDEWYPDFIATLKECLDIHSEHGVAMSSILRVYKNNSFFDEILLIDENNLTNFDYITVFKKMMNGVRIHLFCYGLFRSELLKKLTARPFSDCIASDRVFMCEVALATHFYSVPQILYKKTVSEIPIEERNKDNEVGRVYIYKTKHIRYVINILTSVLTSSLIPLKRKIRIIPMWLIFACSYCINYIRRDILFPIKKKIKKYLLNIMSF